ncbi:MAG TPA: hypothetical protein VGP08_04510 [Pyrinomonadaceae bacterium]|jgi:hypothetical protein|nr:hypothetical protein [Pyrinomonadaceae bacterium]
MTALVDKLFGLPYRFWIALGALALLVLFVVLFKRVTARYETTHEPLIPRLQRAWSGARFKQILQEWSKVNDRAAEIYKRDNLIKLDLLFPLVYACYFAFAYAWARGVKSPVNGWDYFFFLAPFCAALFDYLEDGTHLYLLRGVNTGEQVDAAAFPDALVHVSTLFSYVKFAFFDIAAVAYVVALVVRLVNR